MFLRLEVIFSPIPVSVISLISPKFISSPYSKFPGWRRGRRSVQGARASPVRLQPPRLQPGRRRPPPLAGRRKEAGGLRPGPEVPHEGQLHDVHVPRQGVLLLRRRDGRLPGEVLLKLLMLFL